MLQKQQQRELVAFFQILSDLLKQKKGQIIGIDVHIRIEIESHTLKSGQIDAVISK